MQLAKVRVGTHEETICLVESQSVQPLEPHAEFRTLADLFEARNPAMAVAAMKPRGARLPLDSVTPASRPSISKKFGRRASLISGAWWRGWRNRKAPPRFTTKLYQAARPELFFKATPHRVVGPGGSVRIRVDAKWNVPEPELALVINSRMQLVGFTAGNDMSSRDIEVEVGGMLVSDDSGHSWTPANNGLTDMDVHEIVASEHNIGMVYLACGESCFRSADRAAHWENISPKTHDYGTAVAEDKNGVVYVGCARGRPNLWLREEGADGAIFRSRDKGSNWEKVADHLKGGVMHMCPTPDGNGMVAGTSDGNLLVIDDSGMREVATGLPFVTSVELAA